MKNTTENNGQEKKLLNLFDIFCLGFGGAIGSGIFVLLGMGIGFTGRSIVLVVAVGCVFMLLAYMYHVVLSSMFVFRGGDYSQKALLFNPTFTGVSAIFTLLNGFALAMYGMAMVDYASMIFPGILPLKQIIAVVVITLFFAATIKGSKFVAVLNSIMTIILTISIVVFIIFGAPQVQANFFRSEGFFTGGVGGFFSAISIMGWACQGTTMGPTSMASTTKNPKKTIPKSILLITLCLAVVYSLMAFVASGVLPLEEVTNQNLSAVANRIFSYPVYVIFILGGAVFAIATSLMGAIAMLRYPAHQVAKDGWLPKAFTKTTKGGYPWVIQLLFYLLSVVPIIAGFSLDTIVSLVMIPSMLLCCYMNFACIGVIKKYPAQWKKSIIHMPVPVITVIMILACICDLIVAYNLFIQMKPMGMVLVAAMLLFCFGIAFVRLKTGAVKVEILEERKRAIIEEALQDDSLNSETSVEA